LAKGEIFQHCVSLAKAFPALGTPTMAARHYGQFPEEFFEDLSKDQVFSLDIAALSEHNRREAEAMEKARKEGKTEKKYSMREARAKAMGYLKKKDEAQEA
jgi:hypothetical protein